MCHEHVLVSATRSAIARPCYTGSMILHWHRSNVVDGHAINHDETCQLFRSTALRTPHVSNLDEYIFPTLKDSIPKPKWCQTNGSVTLLLRTLARVPSTQYPATMTPFLWSVHQLSNNSRDKPLCIIPGDAMTTDGPTSSKCSIPWEKHRATLRCVSNTKTSHMHEGCRPGTIRTLFQCTA